MSPFNNQETDDDLLQRFRNFEDADALGFLLKRYSLLVFGVCMKYLKNSADAKDATQQVFEKVIREVPKYEIPYFKSWIYSVARNHCLMSIRSASTKPRKLDEMPEEIVSEDPSFQEIKGHELSLMHRESSLLEALNELNMEQSTCIRLFYLENLSYQEIQGKTGYTFQQVKSHIQNGRRNLKIILAQKFREDEK